MPRLLERFSRSTVHRGITGVLDEVLRDSRRDAILETLDLLREKLAEYAGSVLLVSHDRDFLDRVVTSVIVSEGNGRRIEYAGGCAGVAGGGGA